MSTQVVEGNKENAAGFAFSRGVESFTEAHKEINKALSDHDDSYAELDTAGMSEEMSLFQRIEKGPWHLIEFSRQNGQDFGGFLVFPNYINGKMYQIPYGRPYWVPDYIKNIALESKRLETTYDRANEASDGQPKMMASVDAIQCHPFIVHRTVKGRPPEAKAV